MTARRFWLGLGAITLVGWLVRIVYIVGWRWDVTPGVVEQVNDAAWYHQASRLLADGHGFISPFFSAPGHPYPAADHPPVYQLFLALFAKIGIDGANAQTLLTATFIGAPTVWIAGLAGRALRDERVGLVAAGLVAVSPNVFSWDGMLYSESAALFSVTLTLWAAYAYWRDPTLRRAVVLGAAASLATMSRAEFVLLLPVVALPLVLRHGAPERRERLRRVGAVALSALVLVGPWVGFNMVRFEHPVYLSVGAEITMASATCEQTYYGEFLGFWYQPCAQAVRDDINGRFPPIVVEADGRTYQVPALDQSEEAPYFRDAAVGYLRDNLDRFPAVLLARYGRVTYLFRPANVVRDDHYFEGRDLGIAQAGRWSFYVLALLAIAGTRALRRARIPRYPALAPFLTVLAAVSLAFGNPRYRAASETALCLLAAVGAVALAERWLRRSRSDGAPAEEPTPVV